MPHQNLHTYCAPEIKRAFEASAYALGCTSSALMRRLLLQHLATENRIDPPTRPVHQKRFHRLSLTLSPAEFEAVKRHAADYGTVGEWLLGLVRSRIHRRVPMLSRSELAALLASNRELWAIGRNLNQIARRLNEDAKQTGRVQDSLAWVEEIGVLRRQIEVHTAQVVATCNASAKRWDAADE
jgi:hypothetical protein